MARFSQLASPNDLQPDNRDESDDDALRAPLLRNVTFDDIIGQSHIKEALRMFIQASVKNDQPLAHVLLKGRPGLGKCLGVGTPVLLFDGTVKPVESILVGDQLMGPDSQPRTVQSISTGHGLMHHISPTKGQSWTCNDIHMMTLWDGRHHRVVDVQLNQLRDPGRMKLIRTGVEWPNPTEFLFDPYLCGLWLGDGTLARPQITNSDPEVQEYCLSIARDYDCEANVFVHTERAPTIRFRSGPRGGVPHDNAIWRGLKRLKDDDEKRIPHEYLTASRTDRLALLAGLADTDGDCSNGLVISTKYPRLADQVAFLARSLGFAAYITTRQGRIKSLNFEATYSVVNISGDLSTIPTRVARNKMASRKQIKDVLHTGFTTIPLGIGTYYGFTLDGDGRFLLGDFTITHNTTFAHAIAHELGKTVLSLDGPALTAERLSRAIANDLAPDNKLLAIHGLSTRNPNTVLLIDEVHAIPQATLELLYPIMEDFTYNGRRLPPFTLIGATTDPGKLPTPFRDRFGIDFTIDYYTVDDLVEIGEQQYRKNDKLNDHEGLQPALQALAVRSHGTPRLMLRLLARSLDITVVRDLMWLTTDTVAFTMMMLGIDKYGLDEVDRKIILALAQYNRPVGIAAVASSVGEADSTIENVNEPWLVRAGFVERTQRGRQLTSPVGVMIAHQLINGDIEWQ